MKVYAVCSKLPTCRLVKMHNGKPFRYCITQVASEKISRDAASRVEKEPREIKGKPIKVEWIS